MQMNVIPKTAGYQAEVTSNAGPTHCGSATFAVVTYGGDKKTLVNTNCAIVHLLLHLRAKCIGDGFAIGDNICIEGSRINCRSKSHKSSYDDDDEDIEYMDLLDRDATPVELSNHDPLSFAKTHLKHRSEYVLCSVKKTKDGIIKEANPLLVKPSMDLKRRINTVLRTIEKFKTRIAMVEKSPAIKEARRKGQKKTPSKP